MSKTKKKYENPIMNEVKPKNEHQEKYIAAIKTFQLIFATGPAGTGKTWLATAMAAKALYEKRIEKIIVTRPSIEAGGTLGHLPGTIDEKFEPYLIPYIETFEERLGRSHTEYLLKTKSIEASPLGYMRGRTFKNCWVLLDEAQNTKPSQMKMFLTRIGENCKMIINGDLFQSDIQGISGLEDAVEKLYHIPSVKVINFQKQDVVRSSLVQEIVEAYNEPDR